LKSWFSAFTIKSWFSAFEKLIFSFHHPKLVFSMSGAVLQPVGGSVFFMSEVPLYRTVQGYLAHKKNTTVQGYLALKGMAMPFRKMPSHHART